MLVNNVDGERKASSILKSSEFYIDVAKFVQAYTTIIKHPNEFLEAAKEPLLKSDDDQLTWDQFVKIVQKCELGFNKIPTSKELIVYYNYALDIGTISDKERKLATVDDVANAQKHYYNFVDEAKDRAEEEYYRQKRISQRRQEESAVVDNKLSLIKTGNYIAVTMMILSCLMICFGVVSLFASNAVAVLFGSFIKGDGAQYVGACIIVALGILMFYLFDKLYVKTKVKFLNLKKASETIFSRSDETYMVTQTLKAKLDVLKKDLKTVHKELNDKHKRFDVKHNIEVLVSTNKLYQQYAELEQENDFVMQTKEAASEAMSYEENEFAPIRLTKEQEENLYNVSKEVIQSEGQFDMDAYNEKFEQVKDDKKKARAEEKEQEEKAQESQITESVDLIKSSLGMTDKNAAQAQKQAQQQQVQQQEQKQVQEAQKEQDKVEQEL